MNVFILRVLILVALFLFTAIPQAHAATQTLTSFADFEAGTYNNTEAYSTKGQLKIEDAGGWSSEYTNSTPLPYAQGSTAESDGTYVYFLYALDNYFARYNPTSNNWKELTNPPFSASSYKSDMTYMNGYMYVLFGGYQTKFARYDIDADSWETLEDLPDYTFYGASLSNDGTNVYVLRGTNTTDFWRYNVSSDTWTTLTVAPATMYTGADLVYDDGYLYTPRGNNTTTFYRYSISGNSWSTMTAAPATLNGDHDIVTDGTYIYVTRSGSQNTFYRYSIAGNSWTTLGTTPQTVNYHGFVHVSSIDTMYMFRGLGAYDVWTYDPDADEFTFIEALPTTLGTGSDLIHLSGYLYLVRGTSTNYYRYNLSSNTWETLTSAPGNIQAEQKGVAAGSLLYYFAGSGTTFYSYNPASNTWSTLAVAPAAVSAGDSLMYPGTGDYIYASRGNNTSSIWRYSISGNSWNDAAVADLPTGYVMYIGSRLLTDGTDIYAITGGTGKSRLFGYDINGDSWEDLGALPFNPYYGTDGVHYDGKLYFQSGYYRRGFFEYDIASQTWRRLEELAGYLGNNIGPYTGGSLASDGSGTLYSTYGSVYARMQSYVVEEDYYETSGEWISHILDLTYVSSFTSLTTTESTPDDSTITIETRTSSDGATWDAWTPISGTDIESDPDRYIQVKVTMTPNTDNDETPALSDITITYAGDTTAPTNPSAFTGSSQQVAGSALVDEGSYGYANPYFSWTGASDTESTIAGYYVYFGTDDAADPEEDGVFTTSSGYVTTTAFTNGETYYLRLKTEDSSGNVSAATTGFTYTYEGVTAAEVTFDEAEDYTGEVTDVQISGDTLKLDADEGGIWEQERISLAPAGLSYGAGFAYVESTGKLYTFRGLNTTTFYEYDIASDTWTTLAVAPAAVNYGWIVRGPDGYLYAARGAGTASLWRYDIDADTWDDEAASDAPLTLTSGTAAMWDGSRYIYASRGGSDDAFFRYDTQFDSWETLSNVQFEVLNSMAAGADLAYNGSDTLYVVQGGNLSGFSAYDTSSDTWTTLPTLPHISGSDGTIAYDATQNAIYYLPGSSRVSFFKYDISTETWSELPEAPGVIGQGADIRNVDGKLYVIRGGNQTIVYTYDTVDDAWLIPTIGLFGSSYFRGTEYLTFNYGAEIEKGNGNYYYISRGNYDNMFIRYDAATGAVLRLSDIPNALYLGGSLAYDDDAQKIYATAAANDTGLYSYDIATDTWSEITSDPLPAAPGTGASLMYDGAQYLYYLRAGGTTSFYRYNTQGSAGARWSTMATAPASMSYGAELVLKNGNIYTPRGGNQVQFYRYNISGNSWSTLTSVTASVHNDGFLVDGGTDDTLIACRGVNTNTCYQYSISGDSWSAIDDAPVNFSVGGSGSTDGSRMYAIGGTGTNSISYGIYSYILPTDSTSFQRSGSYTSQTHDLSSVYRFANLEVNYTAASADTLLTPYTRTSTDGEEWSSWTAAANKKQDGNVYEYQIKSPDAQYIEVRFDFSSGGGLYSDVVNSYAIHYYTDTTAPTNPTALESYSSATQSATIDTDTWYGHTAPQFEWPTPGEEGSAADGDGGSGVSGYYVYFGTDSDADPEEDGALQDADENTYTASSLSSGSTYYVRIKTVDDAGNVADEVWQPFIYKYDSTAPTNPSSVSASPPGYSTSSVFTFTWTAGSDAHSGIDVYCWSTQTAGVSETCTEDRIATASAYTTGANSFYVRARDATGSYASSYANATYYYTGGAPGAPTDLTATPSTNTTNAFTFTWEAPVVDGSESDIMYFYSVNALPTADNVTQVGRTRVLPSDAYATQKGANILYVVAQYPSTYTIDEDPESIDFNNYASVVFTANTTAPGAPEAVEIADVSVKSTESWKLALTWNEPTSSGSGVAVYKVYRSATASASCTTNIADFTNVASTSEPSYVGSNLLQQTYYYCAKACDSTGNCSPASSTVSMFPDGRWESAPELVASPSATMKTRTATIEWSTDRTASSFIKYGKSAGEYGEEVGSSDQVTAHEVALKDLEPGTKYYYKALWTDEDGNTGESDELSFTTNAAPYVANVEVTDIRMQEAYVSANITHASAASLQYGPTTAYGGSIPIPVSPSGGIYSVKLDDLEEDTEYHIRIVAEDDESNEYIGEDHTFRTYPIPKIDETLLKIQQVAGLPTATMRIIWSTNTETSSVVTYYPTASPQLAKDLVTVARSINHQVLLQELADETEYTIIIKGRDIAGNETLPVTRKVATAVDLRQPAIIDMTVESTIAGVGTNAKAQIIVCWKTDEPGTTQVEYNQGTSGDYGSATQEDTTLTSDHCVTIAGAEAATIYQLRAVSKDKAGNVGRSFDTIIVTPQATKAAFDLVIDKLSATFGFLRRLQ